MGVQELSELEKIPQGRILSIDYGVKRIGLAKSDPSQFLTSTLTTLQNDREVLPNLQKIIAEEEIQLIVVGKPLHMSGAESESSAKALDFAEKLTDIFSGPIVLWDERWTTQSAHKLMHETGKKPSREKGKVDQIAAAFLLQSFLDRISILKR